MDSGILMKALINGLIFALTCSTCFLLVLPYRSDLKRYTYVKLTSVLFLGYLPLQYLNAGTRLFYFFIILVFSSAIILRLNIIQAVLLSLIYIFTSIIFETISTIIVINVFHFTQDQIISDVSALAVVFFVVTWSIAILNFYIMRNKIRRLIAHKHFLKKNQLYLFLFVMLIFGGYVAVLNGLAEYDLKYIVMGQFIFDLIFVGATIGFIILTYSSYRKANQNKSITRLIETLKSTSPSNSNHAVEVELDLYQTGFSGALYSEYNFEALLHQSDNSLLFLMIGEDDQKYVLKAMKKISKPFVLKTGKATQFYNEIVNQFESVKYYYLIKPYVNGLDLRRKVEVHGPLDEEDASRMVHQICKGLKELDDYSKTFVHRDIKPDNLILTDKGQLKIIDLETARNYSPDKIQDTIVVASRGYTAPEQFGFTQTDVRSDIYSIGATYYFLLTGSTPDYHSIHSDVINSVGNLSPKSINFIRKCMSFDPDGRFESLEELLLWI